LHRLVKYVSSNAGEIELLIDSGVDKYDPECCVDDDVGCVCESDVVIRNLPMIESSCFFVFDSVVLHLVADDFLLVVEEEDNCTSCLEARPRTALTQH